MSESHYVEWDQPGRRLVRALCGTLIHRIEHDNAPTCLYCRRALAERHDERTAEDVFGPPDSTPRPSIP